MSAEVAKARNAPESSGVPWPNGVMAGLPLRVQAQIHYVYVDQTISLARMAVSPPFDAVPLRTLEYWSATDRWTEQRRQFEEDVTARVRDKVCDELVQKRVDQLDNLEKVEKEILTALKAGKIQWRSKESAVHAFVRLALAVDGLREKILTDLPGARSQGQEKMLTPSLSPDEVRAAVKAILETRRKRKRAEGAEQLGPEPA